MSGTETARVSAVQQEELLYSALSRAAASLGIQVDRSELDLQGSLTDGQSTDSSSLFEVGARQLGLAVRRTEITSWKEILDIIAEGLPVIAIQGELNCLLFRRVVGKQIELDDITPSDVSSSTISRSNFRHIINGDETLCLLVAKRELECDSISSTPVHDASHQHGHHQLSPIRRFLGLMRMDARDIGTVALFALVAGVLGLAIPLAVESLVNVVSWGVYLQPLVVLAIMLLTCLGFSAALRVMQTIVVEIIQRRQLVRIVSDLAHRFPRASREHLVGEFPRELANRVFDIMTIQKATAILLVDGVSIVLTAILGLLLLAFYHPFLLGFDLVLLICMIVITWLLGRGGISTAIQESITKYSIAHWLQDVLDSPGAFRVNGGEAMAIDRASRLATAYVQARKKQFRVVLRQVIFAVGLQVIASTALLGLGGWLVIQGQLTLGQLVASELVVTVVVGAFSKAGKSLEKYYDLMAGVDKVGHLLDIPVEPHSEVGFPTGSPLELKWDDLELQSGTVRLQLPSSTVAAGSMLAVLGGEQASLFLDALAGLCEPKSGLIEAGGFAVHRLAVGCQQGQAVGYAGRLEVFKGSVFENVSLDRSCVGRTRVREVLQLVGLWSDVVRLDDGVDSVLQTAGFPLSNTQVAKLMIARAIAGNPGVVLINGLLDGLSSEDQRTIVESLRSLNASSTLVVGTRQAALADKFENVLRVE